MNNNSRILNLKKERSTNSGHDCYHLYRNASLTYSSLDIIAPLENKATETVDSALSFYYQKPAFFEATGH